MLTSYDFDGFKGKFIYKWSFLAGKIIEFDPGLQELSFTNRTGYIACDTREGHHNFYKKQ